MSQPQLDEFKNSERGVGQQIPKHIAEQMLELEECRSAFEVVPQATIPIKSTFEHLRWRDTHDKHVLDLHEYGSQVCNKLYE